MKTLRLFLPALALVLVGLRADAADDTTGDWAKAIAAVSAARKAPTVAETRNGVVRPTVTENRNACGCDDCECGCLDGGPCLCDTDPATGKCRCKSKKVSAADPFSDDAARWKDAKVQAPILWSQGGRAYDVPVFSGGVMYGVPVSDLSLLGPPPPDIVGAPIITTIPYQPQQQTYQQQSYYQPRQMAYQYQQQSHYSPPQQQASYSYQQGGLFGQRRSYSVQQSYQPPSMATYGGYRPAGAMICGPGGCTLGN